MEYLFVDVGEIKANKYRSHIYTSLEQTFSSIDIICRMTEDNCPGLSNTEMRQSPKYGTDSRD